MIPKAFINAWAQIVPWANPDQVEQDLALSRLIVEIGSHPLLADELAFRGGTCLHKLHLRTALRYSDDLDYVRATHGPIGPAFDALREFGANVRMSVATEIGQVPKFFFRSAYESGDGRMQVKVEINTYDNSPARPHIRLPYALDSPWWAGRAEILTFEPEELIATKLRALYQRRKGRDLFDLWVALRLVGLDPAEILECFRPYRPDGYTSEAAVANLRQHLADPLFRSDLEPLVVLGKSLGDAEATVLERYDIDEAAELVIVKLLSLV